ncbi:MAG: AAA family ATPase [Thermodesulfovibrionales bacterium]
MRLRISAFRIRNFRCIKDTNWCDLSTDNITTLIGQNESGKTSVLDGIHSFFTGKIIADDIRSDDTLPEISCSFEIESGTVKDVFLDKKLPAKLNTAVLKRINIVRVWERGLESEVSLEEKSVKNIFEEALKIGDEKLQKIKEEVIALADQIKQCTQESAKKQVTLASETTEDIKAKITKEIDDLKTKVETDTKKKTELEASTSEIKIDNDTIVNEKEFVKTILKYLPDVVIFRDESSLLPDKIDLSDLEKENEEALGYQGALNFLAILGIDIALLKTGDQRIVENQIATHNKLITADFQEFWTQKIGKTNKIGLQFELKNHDASVPSKAGEPYLVFWINDGEEKLYLKQRSKGVRWFISFYLQLKASAEKRGESDNKILFLIDEPGASLHAKGQEDALKVFEEIKDKNIQVVYTTHSPSFIKLETVFRILAVQRNEEDKEISDTRIFNAHQLGAANTNTLSPLYAIMGVNLAHQGVIKRENNIILEEISAFYYISAFLKLTKSKQEVYFLPATGATNISQLAYLFLGWGLNFAVIVDDDKRGREVYKKLKEALYCNDDEVAKKHIMKIKDCQGIEDIFTKSDFTKLVLKDPNVKIESSNSEYINKGSAAKACVALKFYLEVNNGLISVDSLDHQSNRKIKELVDGAVELLKN